MSKTRKPQFGKAYFTPGVQLIKTKTKGRFRDLSRKAVKKPENVKIREFPHRRALLLRPSPVDQTSEAIKAAHTSATRFARTLLDVESAVTLPAYSLSNRPVPPFIFPTGVILVLTDDKRIRDIQRRVSRFKIQSVRRVPRAPVLRVQLRRGDEDRAGVVEEQIAKIPGVLAATADFSYYGPFDWSLHQIEEPPENIHSDSVLRRNRIDRAWEFGMGQPGINVGVIDKNFHDHVDLNYELAHAFDAADGDHDPRSPLSPRDADISWPLGYRHGTEMSGVIASRGTVRPEIGTGVSPNANIVPYRAMDVSVDLFEETQAFLDEFVNEWISAIIEIYYSGVPVVNASITIELNPIFVVRLVQLVNRA